VAAGLKRAGLPSNSISGAAAYAFKDAGVEFIDEDGGGSVIRLRKRPLKKGYVRPSSRWLHAL
jgi:hypothetical protein